jgi:hypothetical protein
MRGPAGDRCILLDAFTVVATTAVGTADRPAMRSGHPDAVGLSRWTPAARSIVTEPGCLPIRNDRCARHGDVICRTMTLIAGRGRSASRVARDESRLRTARSPPAVIIDLATLTLITEVRLSLGVLGHEGSTPLVVANSLRLLAHCGPGRAQAETRKAESCNGMAAACWIAALIGILRMHIKARPILDTRARHPPDGMYSAVRDVDSRGGARTSASPDLARPFADTRSRCDIGSR